MSEIFADEKALIEDLVRRQAELEQRVVELEQRPGGELPDVWPEEIIHKRADGSVINTWYKAQP